jgi:hypothetical protein
MNCRRTASELASALLSNQQEQPTAQHLHTGIQNIEPKLGTTFLAGILKSSMCDGSRSIMTSTVLVLVVLVLLVVQ